MRRDHPRSRGVYDAYDGMKELKIGSSPLARGLLHQVMRNRVKHRIIPARAGFTHARNSASTRTWDHPRSRGVYSITLFREISYIGSSPLARGLLVVLDFKH